MKARMFDKDHATVKIYCPGCKTGHYMNIEPRNGRPAWGFNQDYANPTFTPSLLVRTGMYAAPEWFAALEEGEDKEFHRKHSTICHSFITNGQMQFLTDSTHALAGQTVALPELESVEDPQPPPESSPA